MRHPLAASALAALAALAASCTPPSTPSDAGVPAVDAGPLAASAYCESIVDFFCPFYLRCGRMAVADVDACRAPFLESCEAKYEPTYVDLEAAGLLTLSRAGVEACRAHLDDVACADQPLDLDGPCGAMWVGAQPAGAPCGFDVESFVCAPGTTCVLSLDLCGTCRTVVEDGAPCGGGLDVACGRGSTCVDGACAPRDRVAPTYVDVGDACDQQNRCPYLSRCAGGTCVESALLGQTCTAEGGCASGFCDGTCEELLPPQAPCESSAQCRTACVEGACIAVPSACFDP